MNASIPHTLDGLFDLFQERGAALYLGEAVTQLEHAEQCAALARAEGAPDALVVAAFLHDIGHLLFADHAGGTDDRHEASGAVLVSRILGDAVAGPIRLHVAAKRHLCGTDPGYAEKLSPTSVASLAAQGGAFDIGEQARFLQEPYAGAALALRRWDDLGKTPGAPGLSLEVVRNIARSLTAV